MYRVLFSNITWIFLPLFLKSLNFIRQFKRTFRKSKQKTIILISLINGKNTENVFKDELKYFNDHSLNNIVIVAIKVLFLKHSHLQFHENAYLTYRVKLLLIIQEELLRLINTTYFSINIV